MTYDAMDFDALHYETRQIVRMLYPNSVQIDRHLGPDLLQMPEFTYETIRIPIDQMTPLNHEQFKRRYNVADREQLLERIDRHSRDLLSHDDSRVLNNEVHLRLIVTRPPPSSHKGPDMRAVVLRGYRILEINRAQPHSPVTRAAYSKLTGKFHVISWMDPDSLPHLGVRTLLTDAGRGVLNFMTLGASNRALSDELTRQVLMLSQLPPPVHSYAAWGLRVDTGDLNPETDEPGVRSFYVQRLLDNLTNGGKTTTPDHSQWDRAKLVQVWTRILGYDRTSLHGIWKLVDQFGLPAGAMGEALRHMDKFRTF